MLPVLLYLNKAAVNFLYNVLGHILGGKYLVVKLLGHKVDAYLTLSETGKDFSQVFVPFNSPPNST